MIRAVIPPIDTVAAASSQRISLPAAACAPFEGETGWIRHPCHQPRQRRCASLARTIHTCFAILIPRSSDPTTAATGHRGSRASSRRSCWLSARTGCPALSRAPSRYGQYRRPTDIVLALPPPDGDLGPCCLAADPCPRASSRRGRSHPPSSSVLPKILRPSRSRRSSRLLERALLLGFRALLVLEETVDDRARGSLCRSASGSGYLPCPPPSPGCGIRVCVGWGVCVYIYVFGVCLCVNTTIGTQHRVLLVASAAAHWLRSK